MFLKRLSAFSLLLGLLACSGCGLIYTNIRSPYSYRSAAPSEVKAAAGDEIVSGKACDRSLLFLVAWGDAGYAAAVKDALGARTDAVLYDVKCDLKVTSVLLGAYTKTCTDVTGRVGRL